MKKDSAKPTPQLNMVQIIMIYTLIIITGSIFARIGVFNQIDTIIRGEEQNDSANQS